jgi:signal transduction histidine kinase
MVMVLPAMLLSLPGMSVTRVETVEMSCAADLPELVGKGNSIMSSQQTVVYAGGDDSPWYQAFAELSSSNAIDLAAVPNTKKALKYFRKHPHVAVLAIEAGAAELSALEKLAHSIRNAMHDQKVRIVVCATDQGLSGASLVKTLGVNAVLHPGTDLSDRLHAQLQAELQTNALIRGTQSRHKAETGLLTAIARFSRLEMKLSDCLAELARSTGQLTGAAVVNVIMVRRDGTLRRSSVTYQADDIDASQWIAANQAPSSSRLLQVVEEARLQLYIQADDPEHQAASDQLNCEIAGRFIYPLRSFGRTMCLVECWLPAKGLELVSVDLVRLIEKSSEQFSLLFERKQADKQLKRQYKRLKFTLDELSSAKNALYHSEKLASIGQLAAGIAHEINNPVAYVMGNFNPLNDYVDSMTRMLDLHSQFVSLIDQADVSVGSDVRQQIDEMGADLDMDYVMEDVRSLVSESKNGLVRVREIILNLNQFARKDSVDAEPMDMNAAIEATLQILHNEVKYGVEVSLDFAELPAVVCQPGLIKQVLLNLIKNGAQAMGGAGKMHISTAIEGPLAVVRVRDSGTGIPADALEKIFDPFFTTKPVGEGTGLGLSLCHGIVERHNGVLEVAETGESGTEFRLALPIEGVDELPDKLAA